MEPAKLSRGFLPRLRAPLAALGLALSLLQQAGAVTARPAGAKAPVFRASPGIAGAPKALAPRVSPLSPFGALSPRAKAPAALSPGLSGGDLSLAPPIMEAASLKTDLPESSIPASPLQALMEHGPLAAEEAFRNGLGDASEASRANFNAAAALGGTGGGRTPQSGVLSAADEDPTVKLVAENLGPVVDESEAPGIYRALRPIFENLSQAQKRLFPGDVLVLNRIFVIDTPVLNAFVHQAKNPGVRRMSNGVYLTTGILRRMLTTERGEPDLKPGMIRLIGIMAHELAHPLEHADKEKLSQHHGAEAAGQALEIRADAEGSRIAREAGYPADSVYRGLSRLFDRPAGPDSALSAAASTHPQDDMRLAAQRMLLTLDRYERGKDPAPARVGLTLSLLDELGGLGKAAAYWKFDWPKSPAEAVERLERLGDSDRTKDYKEIEANRLLLAFDQLLIRKGEALEEADYQALASMSLLLTEKKDFEVWTAPQLREKLSAANGSLEFLSYPSHATAIGKAYAYRSPRHREWARGRYFTKPYEGYGDLERNLRRAVAVLPLDVLFQDFGERIAQDLPTEIHFHPTIRYVYDSSLAKDKTVEFQVRLAHLFHTKVLPKLSESDRIAFFTSSSHDNYSYVFPQTRRERKHPPRGILVDVAELLGDRRKKDQADLYRRAMASLWERRGYYGTLEFIMEYDNMDWRAVWAVLGIDPLVGAAELRQAVKKFTLSPEYPALLRVIADSKSEGVRFAQRVLGVSKFDSMTWTDRTLAPFLSGDKNEGVRSVPELWDLARGSFAGSFYGTKEEVFRKRYRARLGERFKAEKDGSLLERLTRAHKAAFSDILGSPGRSQGFLRDVQAEFVAGLDIPKEDKAAALEALFLKSYTSQEAVRSLTDESPAGRWLLAEKGGGRAIFKILMTQGVVQDALDLFDRLGENEGYDGSSGYSEHFRFVKALKAELLESLRERLSRAPTPRGKAGVAEDFATRILDPGLGRYPSQESVQSRAVRELKAAVAKAAGEAAPLPEEAALRIFTSLTGTGATPATDEFFKRRLAARFERRLSARTHAQLDRLLRERKLHSPALQLDLARRILEPRVAGLARRAPDPAAVHRLIETLNVYAPQGSMRKDEFLESLAWRLDLSGTELRSLIEDEKSYNWRKANPLLARMGSGLSAEIAKLTPAARLRFIEFLVDPEGRELPPEIFKEMERNLRQAAAAAARADKSNGSAAELQREASDVADRMKLQIETALSDASPFERIPLFELLLSAGADGLALAPDFPRNISRPFLGYAAGSNEEKMLAAFLRVVPAHERTVSVAYLLSQAGGDKSSVKNLFEVFQTVGIKFGQFSSTWKIFGEEIARETKSLKSSARPMTKAEILELARRELSPEEFGRIKRFKKILGSASLKTVVLVELTDGGQAVMLAQRPRAAEQIDSNLALAQDFLKELEAEGVKVTAAMFDSIIDAVRAQLGAELKMKDESAHIMRAKGLFEGLNASLGERMNGWRFEVPALLEGFQVRDNLLFLHKAEGVTFDRLEPKDQAQAGPWIAESSLRLLLREGWFDPDRHIGNQLIDAKTKTIYPLDFGQATSFSRARPWRSDDREVLGRFIRAMEEDDAAGVVRFGKAMADSTSKLRDGAKLQERVTAILGTGRDPVERLVGLVNAFADHGLRLEGRFSFGALKGLMTLYGEGYAAPEVFRGILRSEITRLLKGKWTLLLLERIRGKETSPPPEQ